MTMAPEDAYKLAKEIALSILEGSLAEGQPNTPELVEKALDETMLLPRFKDVDRERLRAELEAKRQITVSDALILEGDPDNHRPWLPEKKATTTWRFWHRYRRYLLHRKGWSPNVINKMDEMTDQVLERLEDPADVTRPWNCRGMVVGYVQSGKTANYTGLICKAVDAGYKVIIVLAGQHEGLRGQTQTRLDEEFHGRDSVTRNLIGVCDARIEEYIPVDTMTNRLTDGDGDFTKNKANVLVNIGEKPLLFVVKKNGHVLRTVLRYIRDVLKARHNPDESQKIRGIPLLLIDDEADHSSINTIEVEFKQDGTIDEDSTPSRINGLIRQILGTFEQTSYIGYTATPFANIFINPDHEHPIFGNDLFPRHFIISLPRPSNYIGPVELFGLREDDTQGMPIVRTVDDAAGIVPRGVDAGQMPGPIPPSLTNAIHSFVLAAAAKRVRGMRTVHNSMMVHVTRYVVGQNEIARQISEHVDWLRGCIEDGAGRSPRDPRVELKRMWEADFMPTSSRLGAKAPAWSEVEAELLPTLQKLKVRRLHGRATDTLDYYDQRDVGLNVIAIGGDRLSRGLTLEGLTVSYYLRASTMYDTLMQMGRWFGYRDGYGDLCRLYTTHELQDWFRHIAEANEELREEFENMVAEHQTPQTYGLRVLSHPVMTVTSAVKMRDAATIRISYEGALSETTTFDVSPAALNRNLEAAEVLLRQLPGRPEVRNHNHIWNNVPGSIVVEFLRRYATHKNARRVQGTFLASYIDRQVRDRGELNSWTVAFISNDPDSPTRGQRPRITPLGDLRIAEVFRTPREIAPTLRVQRLLSPGDEALDFSSAELDQFRKNEAAARGVPEDAVEAKGPALRRARPSRRGLLLVYLVNPNTSDAAEKFAGFTLDKPLVGFGVSFPGDPDAIPIEYEVNPVGQREL